MNAKAKELKSLSRGDLLELLLAQTERVEQLEQELTETRKRAETKEILISKAGTLAEAALSINQVWRAADQAAAQYLSNILRLYDEEVKKRKRPWGNENGEEPGVDLVERETWERCEAMERETQEKCEAMERATWEKCKALEEEVRNLCATTEAETQAKCREAEQATALACEEMKEKAREEAKDYWEKVHSKLEQYCAAHRELKPLLQGKG